MGIDTILLWGAEYWQFRKTRYRDAAWWDEVRRLLRQEHIVAEARLEPLGGDNTAGHPPLLTNPTH